MNTPPMSLDGSIQKKVLKRPAHSKTPAVDLRIEDRKVIFLQRSASDFFNRISLAFHPLRVWLNGPYVRCGA